MRTLLVAILLGLCSRAAFGAPPLPAQLPAHPRLLFTSNDLPQIKQRIATQPWAQARFAELRQQSDRWLKSVVVLPPRGSQWYHYYSCPKHGARLRTEGPTRHVCPIDGEVLTGYPYDDVVLSSEHNRLAGAIRTLGLTYQLTRDPAYAGKAKEILLAYAAKYRDYPLHNIRGEPKVGGGKVGPQTLDESTWLITVVEGADCFWDTLDDSEQKQVREGLLIPATDVIRQHKMGIHNIQCWKNSAVGLTGLLIGDLNLVNEALNADAGYFRQMAQGTTADGAWFEGAWGYHFYTVSAVVHLTEGALHSGIDLYGDGFKRMFDAPLDLAMPDLRLPAFNDSSTVSVVSQASLYEIAYARYHDPRHRLVIDSRRRDSDAALLHGAAVEGPAPVWQPASRNNPASGFAILASGQGPRATWFCLDYGPHGGGHGHPDKLGFVLFGRGQILAPDPGTANYGVPIQAGWYRTTIAHNTLTVDGESQRPAEGQCEAFVNAPGFSAVLAQAGKIYDGVTYRRAVALLGDDLLLFIDLVAAPQEHTYDLAYHNIGRISVPADAAPFDAGSKPGYAHLRDTKAVSSANGLSLNIAQADAPSLGWRMAHGSPTTYVIGTGVGAHTEDRVPVVIARRQAKETAYLWCVSLSGAADVPELEPEVVTRADGTPVLAAAAAAVRVKTSHGVEVFVVNPRGENIQVLGQSVRAPLAHLVANPAGSFEVRHSGETQNKITP